jgi:hypothetical protein
MFLRIFTDLVILTTDVPTLFGVATGLAIFTALICFVLKLFSRARYSRPRHYANANLAPPILFSSETGQCSILYHWIVHEDIVCWDYLQSHSRIMKDFLYRSWNLRNFRWFFFFPLPVSKIEFSGIWVFPVSEGQGVLSSVLLNHLSLIIRPRYLKCVVL